MSNNIDGSRRFKPGEKVIVREKNGEASLGKVDRYDDPDGNAQVMIERLNGVVFTVPVTRVAHVTQELLEDLDRVIEDMPDEETGVTVGLSPFRVQFVGWPAYVLAVFGASVFAWLFAAIL